MTATPRPADTGRPFDGLLFPVPSAIGAWIVYSYFRWVNPTGAPLGTTATDVTIVVALTTALLITSSILASHHVRPVLAWVRRLRGGADPGAVPPAVRRRLLNAPLVSAVLTQAAWLVAGAFYFAHQRWLAGSSIREAARVFVGVALVGGPVGAVLSFLVAEFYWRRRIPLFYPDGHLDRGGAIRVPVLARLLATFATLGVLPSFLMLFVAADLAGRSGLDGSGTLGHLVGILAYIAAATGAVSVAMALLVSRFINRPLQALRRGMAQVAGGDLSAHVPVRSTGRADIPPPGQLHRPGGGCVSSAAASRARSSSHRAPHAGIRGDSARRSPRRSPVQRSPSAGHAADTGGTAGRTCRAGGRRRGRARSSWSRMSKLSRRPHASCRRVRGAPGHQPTRPPSPSSRSSCRSRPPRPRRTSASARKAGLDPAVPRCDPITSSYCARVRSDAGLGCRPTAAPQLRGCP